MFPGLETLLCYLELHPQAWVELLHPTLSNCSIQCYGGSQQLRTLTKMYKMTVCVCVSVCERDIFLSVVVAEVELSFRHDQVNLSDIHIVVS